MRRDLDRLMRERGLGGLVVLAYDRYSPAMYYVTGQKIHHGVYFRAADGRAHLIHDPMERDQAALAGCEHSGFPQHRYQERLEKTGHPARAFGQIMAETCGLLSIRGKVSFVGDAPTGFGHELIEELRRNNSEVLPDNGHPDVVGLARITKDPEEVDSIRSSSRGAVAAIERLRAYLEGLEPADGGFRSNGGGKATLGSLRTLIHQELVLHGLEGGECIVSQGRDAGVPHNRGNDAEELRAGTPILVDLFPGEAGGGYHSDLTRTFCLGRAPDDLRGIYEDVHHAFREAVDTLKPGTLCRSYQEKTCEFFEKRGHATLRTNEGAQEGYVHGLGHGVGLAVHEPPRLGGPRTNTQALEPGMVVTVEPGLYYPSRGLGVRIEDLVVVGADGRVENLTPAPYDLEIHPKG